jgi:hypothetical protein
VEVFQTADLAGDAAAVVLVARGLGSETVTRTYLARPPVVEPSVLLVYMSSNAAAGAVSRKSMNSYDPLGAFTSINPPPPMPLWYIPGIVSSEYLRFGRVTDRQHPRRTWSQPSTYRIS